MIQKDHICNFLRLNGISTDAPDEEIRGALAAALWPKQDIDRALLILRGKETDMDMELKERWLAGQKLLHSDTHVAPDVLTTLLGVEVKIKPDLIPIIDDDNTMSSGMSALRYAIFIAGSLVAAAVFIYATFHFGS